MNSDLLHYSAARACVSPSLSPHCSHADGWTFWLLWCNSASSAETSRMTCLKLGGHLNCHLQIDLRLFCPLFNLEGLCSLWSGSCITTLAWNHAQPSKSCPSGAVSHSFWCRAGLCSASLYHWQKTWKTLCQHGPVAMVPRRNCRAFTSLSSRCKAIVSLLFSWLFHSTENLKMLYLKHPQRKSCVSDEPDFLNFLFAAQLSALDGSQGHFFGRICLPQLEARLLELEHKGL